MAIKSTSRQGNNEMKGWARLQSRYHFIFTSVSTGTPLLVWEEEKGAFGGAAGAGAGLIASVAYVSNGLYLVTLTGNYLKIFPTANIDEADCTCNCEVTVEGGAAGSAFLVETAAADSLADVDDPIRVSVDIIHALGG
jgi:hypothetical protein